MISRFAGSPEQRHSSCGPSPSWSAKALHAADSSHGGSKAGPPWSHWLMMCGMGFLRHMLLGGVVPTRVSQPRSVVLNASCDDSFRSQRSMLGPTKSSGILLNVASVSGAPRGASL